MTSNWRRTAALDPAECWKLLSSVRVGRVGLWNEEGPQVLPVNHSVVDGTVLFRTELYGPLADGTRDREVAFEADELDDRLEFGWSVLVAGPVTHVEDPAELADLFGRMGQPWAPGSRLLIARIHPTRVTGRRFSRT